MIASKMQSSIAGARALAIIDELQNKLRSHLPTLVDSMAYRGKILYGEGTYETKTLLENEEKLKRSIRFLNKAIIQDRELQNKKKYTLRRAELQVAENKLKENSNELNRRLKENPVVINNIAKMHNDIEWIVKNLERQKIESFLHENESLPITAEQKIEKFTQVESKLCNDIHMLKQQKEYLKLEEERLSQKRNVINCLDEDLQEIKSGNKKEVILHREKMDARQKSIMKHFKEIETTMKENIDNVKTQIKVEEAAHKETIEFLEEDISMIKDNTSSISNDTLSSLKKLDQCLKGTTAEREDNLQVLLQLQKRWDNDEKIKEEKIMEIKLNKSRRQMEARENEAASFIQKRLKKAFATKR